MWIGGQRREGGGCERVALYKPHNCIERHRINKYNVDPFSRSVAYMLHFINSKSS